MKFPTAEEYSAMTPMQQSWWWIKFVGRHKTIDGMSLSGWEILSQTDVVETTQRVAEFFNLPSPIITESEDAVAKIVTNEDAEASELFYNLKALYDKGINNHDALTLCLVHEMCHQALYGTRFMLFANELWIHELACDIVTGAYAERYNLATNKYKWVVHLHKASPTHPAGKLRELAVDYGRENYFKVRREKNLCDLDGILRLVPSYIYRHLPELAASWKELQQIDWETTFINPPKPKPIRIEDLPDSNLIKQMVMKHRAKQQENERNNEDNGQ